MKKKLPIVIIVLILIVVAWFNWDNWFGARNSQPFELYGNVENRQMQLSFLMPERIAELSVNEGDLIKKGDYLGSLETSRIERELANARAIIPIRQAAVDAAQAQLDKAQNGNRPELIAISKAASLALESKVKSAERETKRNTELYKDHIITKQALDLQNDNVLFYQNILKAVQSGVKMLANGERQENIALALANLNRAKAELDKSNQDITLLEQKLADTKLYAPSDGIVRNRLKEPGEMASPQVPVLTIATVSPKWIRSYVGETDLMKFKIGDPATIQFDGYDKPFSGTISYISSQAEFTPKSIETKELRTHLVYEIRILVEDQENLLKAGAPTTITFPGLS